MSIVKQLIGGGLGLVDAAVDFGFNTATMRQQVNRQKELMDYQSKIRHDQWEEENAYNHPAMQMARLREAGLNPALMNGGGMQPTAATLASTPNAGAPSGSNRQSNIAQRMVAISQLLTDERNRGLLTEQTRLLAQKVINEKIESDIKAIARDTGYTEQKIREMDREALYEAYYGESVYGDAPRIKNNPYTVDMDEARARIRSQNAAASHSEKSVDILDKQIEMLQKQIDWYDRNQEAAIGKLNAEIQKLSNETYALAISNESDSILLERQEFVQSANEFYGFDISDLPPVTKTQVLGSYRDVIKGALSPNEGLKRGFDYIRAAGKKERAIITSWDSSHRVGPFTQSRGGSQNSND